MSAEASTVDVLKAAHTPGPITIREREDWPFYIDGIDATGAVVWSEGRVALSSCQNTLAECLDAKGFKGEDREKVRAALARQMADCRLRAAAPDLLAFARTMDAAWTEMVPAGPDSMGLDGFDTGKKLVAAWRQCRDAIALAEGEV